MLRKRQLMERRRGRLPPFIEGETYNLRFKDEQCCYMLFFYFLAATFAIGAYGMYHLAPSLRRLPPPLTQEEINSSSQSTFDSFLAALHQFVFKTSINEERLLLDKLRKKKEVKSEGGNTVSPTTGLSSDHPLISTTGSTSGAAGSSEDTDKNAPTVTHTPSGQTSAQTTSAPTVTHTPERPTSAQTTSAPTVTHTPSGQTSAQTTSAPTVTYTPSGQTSAQTTSAPTVTHTPSGQTSAQTTSAPTVTHIPEGPTSAQTTSGPVVRVAGAIQSLDPIDSVVYVRTNASALQAKAVPPAWASTQQIQLAITGGCSLTLLHKNQTKQDLYNSWTGFKLFKVNGVADAWGVCEN